MLNLLPIIQHINNIIGATKKFGTYETDGEVEEWTWKHFCFIDHVALGQALYINDVQIWNNW
jgi:hypothetical protein